MLEPARGGLGERAREFRRVALGGDERVDGEGRGGAQDRPDIVRVRDLVEHDDEAVRRQVREVDRLERPGFEKNALMHGVARDARRDVFGGHDSGLDPARCDLGREPFGGGFGRVEADERAARRPQRRLDAVETPDAGNLAAPPAGRGEQGRTASGFGAGRGALRRRSSDWKRGPPRSRLRVMENSLWPEAIL